MRFTGHLLLVAALLFMSFPVFADKCSMPRFLFDGYVFGSNKSDIESLTGVYHGEGEFVDDLFLSEASFADMPWVLRFEFHFDRLVRISLMETYSQARMEAVTKTLMDLRYELLSLLAGTRKLDFIALLKGGGPDMLEKGLSELKNSGSHTRVTYAWFNTENASKEMKMMSRNLREFLMSVGSETREVEVTLLSGIKEGPPQLLIVDFSFPLLTRQ